ncbi:ATP-binding protein [Streptomyces sp. NBC_00190]|uniref:AAA family ATPase n=1 Tax=Streptomyces sp. NBC_00190 TaxID=2903634 RepID=UPI002E2AC725|nr:AAA family ATPase [Streptomyces sp. NBC_00190]
MSQQQAPARPASPKLKTRKPTGQVPYPLLVLEGEEGSGKSYAAAEFSASPLTGQTYWIDLSEGSADEYAAIDGADYLVIDHDGSYRDILEQIEAVHAEACRAAEAGEPPVVLVIDSGSALWRMLTNWTQERARRTRKNKAVLASDPDAGIDIPMNLWNDAVDRWGRVMHLLQTLPGIAIVLARGKEVSAVDENGNPISGRKEWKVSGHKDLGFDATVWVRMKRDEDPHIIKARSLRLRVEKRRPMRLPDFSIEDLVFNRLGCSAKSQPRVMPLLAGDRLAPWLKRVEETSAKEALAKLWRETRPDTSGLTRQEASTIQAAISDRLVQIENPRDDMDQALGDDVAAKLRAAVERGKRVDGASEGEAA